MRREHLTVITNPESISGLRPNWKRRREPVSHVTVRPSTPPLHVYDQAAEVTDDEAAYALSRILRYARDSDHPDLHMAAQSAAVWLADKFRNPRSAS